MARKREDEEEDDFLSEDEIREEEEDEAPAQKPKKKKRKMNPFIDMEAEEDEAEDDDEDEEVEGLIADEDPEADEDRRQARVQHLQRKQLLENDDPEAYAAYIQQRFGEDDEEYDGQPDTSGIDQQSLLPTIRDPRLFIVRVRKPGHERKAIFTLLQKYFTLKRKGVELHIMSAVAPEHLKGIVYVEASTASSVEHAINGLDIFNSYQGVKALRLEEMTDVLKVIKKSDKLKKNDFVRLTKGLYKNDLAQVYRFIEGKENYVMIRLIPRLDIKGEKELMDNDYDDDEEENRPTGLLMNGRRKGRPPQKLFDKEEIYRLTASADMHQERDTYTGEIFDVWNNGFYRHGLLHMQVTIKSLIQGEEVNPQVDEVEKWLAAEQKLRLLHKEDPSAVTNQEARNGFSLNFGSASSNTTKTGLYKGDKVRVYRGEQKGLAGIIMGFDGNMCFIQSPDFPEPLRVNKKDIVKTFNAGETVKVASGKHSGESGSIVSVEGEFLTIFTDSTRKHIRVLASHVADSNDLNVSAAVQSGMQTRTPYELFELVSLVDDNTKGVVVEVFNDAVAVLNAHNRVVKLPFRSIKNKMKDRSARAHDARGNPIAPNDSIHVIAGPSKDRNGVVLHVSGPYIFFRARDEPKNCGVIACFASNVTAQTAAALRLKSSLGNGRGAPAPIPQGSIASLGSGGVMDPRRGPNGGGGRPPPRDALLRQEVKITKGEFKGDRGQVIYADAKFVRVQIASKMKTVRVAKDKVKVIGADGTLQSNAVGGSQSSFGGSQRSNAGFGSSGFGPGGSSSMMPSQPRASAVRTPRDTNYSQTPVSRRYGSETPAAHRYGSMTPRHNFGSATPGPSHTTPRAFAFGSATPRSDAFRPHTPHHNADPYSSNPYGDSVNTPMPMTPAQENPYQPYSRPVPPTPSRTGDGMGMSTPGPYNSAIVEPRTPANNFVPNTPAPFAGGIVEPRTPANGLEPHTPGPMGMEPQTPAPGLEPATPAPGLEPATPAPGLEPATPMVEPTTPHTPHVPQTPMTDEAVADTGEIGYKVLIDVVVSITPENGHSGVVKDASTDGGFVQVQMIDGPKQGQEVTLVGNDITPVQPLTKIDPNALEMVKVLDGAFQGKVGELTAVQGNPGDPDGIVRFQSGETQTLSLSLVAKCQVE